MKISLTILAVALLGISGCHHLAPSKPLSELTAQELSGRQVFLNNCSSCHYANSQRGLQGPGLEGLFREPYLPSGATANDDGVTAVILYGRNMMPAFGGGRLSNEQLVNLMAYLHTL